MFHQGGPSGVRVNSIAPGLIDTPMVSDMTPEIKEYIVKNHQLIDRMIKPEEVKTSSHRLYRIHDCAANKRT